MDPLTLRLVGRILLIAGGLVAIIWGIVLLNSRKEDEEKTEAAHKKGRSYIWSGIIMILLAVFYMLI